MLRTPACRCLCLPQFRQLFCPARYWVKWRTCWTQFQNRQCTGTTHITVHQQQSTETTRTSAETPPPEILALFPDKVQFAKLAVTLPCGAQRKNDQGNRSAVSGAAKYISAFKGLASLNTWTCCWLKGCVTQIWGWLSSPKSRCNRDFTSRLPFKALPLASQGECFSHSSPFVAIYVSIGTLFLAQL